MHNQSVEIVKNERMKQNEILKKIVNNFCDHRVGQKASFVRDGRTVNVVCIRIKAEIYNGKVLYDYNFKMIKKDGSYAKSEVYPALREVTWLNEYVEL